MNRIQHDAGFMLMAVVMGWGASGCCCTKLEHCKTHLAACQKAPKGQVVRTGQTACFDGNGLVTPCAGTGQDGELQKGLVRKCVDNGDGTVTDPQHRTDVGKEK